jgi:uncharacterized protein (DUF1800 family)
MIKQTLTPASIAFHRFGLGASVDDTVVSDARRFLFDQFASYEAVPAVMGLLPDGDALRISFLADRREARRWSSEKLGSPSDTAHQGKVIARQRTSKAGKPSGRTVHIDSKRDYPQDIRALYHSFAQARMASAIHTRAPFVERMVHFWANHFCVSADKLQTLALAGAFERDAIRPHVLGRFVDMLLAVEQHPAMLIYLDQAQSIGPGSLAAQQAWKSNLNRRRGLNENLAREVMELHTLGVRSGYNQKDVTEFAKALTGWTVSDVDDARNGEVMGFRFLSRRHEPGARTIMGQTFAQVGVTQGEAILAGFAKAPQTALHIATKLARHFAGDNPPRTLVNRLAASFTISGGDLPTLYHTLIESPEAWVDHPVKFRSPWDWTVAVLRLLGPDVLRQVQTANILDLLGQPVWKPGSPAGWDDLAASWAGPNALLRRVEIAQRLASLAADRIDARTVGERLLPGSLDQATARQIARAERPATALAILLVSPAMLRR